MNRKKSKKVVKKAFPVWGWIVLGVVLLVVAGFGASQVFDTPAATALPAEISVSQASQDIARGAFVLDVRQPEEWAQYHIAGATLIPLGDLPGRLNEVPKDREIIVVCHSGNRSAQGRDILKSSGFNQVTSLAGGLVEWMAKGLPVTGG
jgi:rhodanese-related sulfurtransferase